MNSRVTYFSIFFVAATMIANVMSLRMVAPLGFVMDAGALLYPLTFLLRDAIHRHSGLQAANRAVTASLICNIAMFSLFALAAWLPYDAMTGTQEEFGRVLLPGFLIVIGSVLGQFVGERIDGRIFHSIYAGSTKNYARAALVSNAISIPIDTTIVCVIAFGLTIPFGSLVETIITNLIIKYAIMVVAVSITAFSISRTIQSK